SLPVMRGFTSGAAVLIIASQLPALFGRGSEGLGVWRAAWRAVTAPESFNLIAIGPGVVTYLVIRGARRVSPLIPGVLIAAVIGLGVTAFFGRVVPVIGPVPSTIPLPTLALPWNQVGTLALGAVVIALVGFAEPAAIARTFADRSRPWNADRELLAQGAANLAAGIMRGMPVGGGFSRAALARQAGGRTRLAGAIAGLTVLAFFPFAGVLAGLPRAVLAAIVVTSSLSLLQLGALLRLWRYAKMQATTALVTFALTLVMTPRVDYALILVILLALFTHLYREAQLGVRVDREGDTVKMSFEGVLWFGSLQSLERALQRLEEELDGIERVVLDTTRLGRVDFSALMLLY